MTRAAPARGAALLPRGVPARPLPRLRHPSRAPGAEVHVEFTVEDAGLRGADLRPARRGSGCSSSRGRASAMSPATASAPQTAADLLAVLGAHDGAACVGRSTPCSATCGERANRRANCDAANARRSAAAGERQAAAARRLHGVAAVGDAACRAARRRASCASLPVPDALPELAELARPAAQQVGAQPSPASAPGARRRPRPADTAFVAPAFASQLHAPRQLGGQLAETVGVAAHLVVVPAEDLDVRERHADRLGLARQASRRAP